MAYNPSSYTPMFDGSRYIPPPAQPDAAWASRMYELNAPQQGSKFGQIMDAIRGKFSNEQGSTNLFTPATYGSGPTNLGSVAQIQQSQIGDAAAAATQSQSRQLINARIAQAQAQTSGIPQMPGVQAGQPVPGNPTLGGQYAANSGAQLSGIPSAPTTVPGSPTLPTAPQYPALGPGQPVNYGNVGGNTPLTGGPGAEFGPSISDLGAEAAAGGGGAGKLAGAKNFLMNGDPALGGGLGAYKSALAENGLIGEGSLGATALGRLGTGSLAAVAPNLLGLATPLSRPLQEAVGIHASPGSLEAGQQAGSDVGTGALVGTMILPGPGTAIGAALGGLKDIVPLGSELVGDISGSGKAQQWGTITDQFNKIISKQGAPKNVGQQASDYLNQTYYQPAQQLMDAAKNGQISHDAAIKQMTNIVSHMQADVNSARTQYKQQGKGGGTQAALGVQMAQALAKSAAPVDASVNNAAQYLQALGAQSNNPAQAAYLNALAAQGQAQVAQNTQEQQASLMVTPQINAMNAQLAQMNQDIATQRSIAQQASSAGSGSLTSAAAAANKKLG